MPAQIETPPWTLFGWLWGVVGLYAAMLYLMGWYFLFAAPFILGFMALAAIFSSFTNDFEISLGMVSLVMSPLSIWFLIWQFFYFLGPAFIDIVRSAGFFLQRAQSLTPKSAIAMMRQRRMHASQQLSNLLNWLSLPFRSDRP
jgi:hypothetical protein